MKKLKVIFVEPKGTEANVFAHYMSLPLMGTIYLGTLLHQKGYDVKIYNENILGRCLQLNELDADVLCLTALTSTANRAYELAGQFKAFNPRGRTVMGGIHASFLPEEAGRFVDHVVIGEGEGVIGDLIEHGSAEKFIYGEMVQDLDSVPIPNFDLLVQNRKLRIWPVIASRGCPHGCNFCSVTPMFGRRHRAVSPDRVLDELKQARRRSVFFYDDNFAANGERTHELLDRMLSAGLNKDWFAQVRADVTHDKELVRKMRRAGCSRVFIGFESVNPDTLKALRKKQSLEEINNSINIFHENGIAIHGMFILGSDEDSADVFDATSKYSLKMGIDTVQFAILTPLPGTEVYRNLEGEGRLLHKLWQYYDGLHVVFQPRQMTPEVLQEGMFSAFEDFYTLANMLNEGLNEAYYMTAELARRMLFFPSRPIQYSTFLKGLGIYLVLKGKRLSAEYMEYLAN